jgi:hypothetical protein
MSKFNKILNFFIKVNEFFATLILNMLNAILMTIIYFFVLGPTSMFAKIFGFSFYKKNQNTKKSYWEKISDKKEYNNYFKQY